MASATNGTIGCGSDAPAEYRGKARVYAFGSYPPAGLDTYEGYLKSWVFLANAFVDLGTWDCFTPFVGAGVGAAYNTFARLYRRQS